MKKTIFFLLACAVVLTAASCSSKLPPAPVDPLQTAWEANEKARLLNEALKRNNPLPPVRWNFTAKAIELRFKADANLNLYGDEAHTLAVAVYQLSDPNAFNTLRNNRETLTGIMDAHRFDQSVVAFDQLFIQPGEDRIFRLDRAENCRFVAIVAGYYQSDPDQVVRLFDIPVLVSPGSRELMASPRKLTVNIFAGPTMIQQFGSN